MRRSGREIEIEQFRKIFQFLQNEKVILYGTGQYTEQILCASVGFQVIGIMDQARKSGVFCGFPVCGEEEIRNSGCRNLIIISNLSFAPIIYRRIKSFTQECGIRVYYMNGLLAGQEENLIQEHPYWQESVESLLAEADNYDVISFDLFDTLIMRKCVFPEEIFKITEFHAAAAGLAVAGFAEVRKAAERALYHSGQRFYSLDDIYRWLQPKLRLDECQLERLKQLELDCELIMCEPRPDIVNCFQILQKRGKTVIITSDMYLSSAQLTVLLEQCGIPGEMLFISGERMASKHLGTMFGLLKKEFYGKRILHIGDNIQSDIRNAVSEGVDAFYIAGPATLAERCSFSLSQNKTSKVVEKRLYELFVQKCFQNAFPLQAGTRRIRILRAEEIGYLFFGPIAAGYLSWLVGQAVEKGIEHLLFISRDGYMFYRMYQKMRQCCDIQGLPEANYFLTSRRCASVSSMRTPADVKFVLDELCSGRFSVRDILEKVYGISSAEAEALPEANIDGEDKHAVWQYIQSHCLDVILRNAAEERTNYRRYIASLAIEGKRVGMMNFVGRGVTQRCLNKIFDVGLTGFYFALEPDAVHIMDKKDCFLSWYPGFVSSHTSKWKLGMLVLYGESVFSAPHGAVVSFSECGEPVYEETPAARSERINAYQKGIMEYFNDILQFGDTFSDISGCMETADEMMGMLLDERFEIPDPMCRGELFEDRYHPVSPGKNP